MARVLVRDVVVHRGHHDIVVLKAGTSVPKDLAEFVTNPDAFIDAEPAQQVAAPAAAAPSTTVPVEDKPVYSNMKKDDIVALATTRGVDAAGSIKEIAARLTASDEAAAMAADEADEADFDSMDEAQLRAYAVEHEIDISQASSSEEIIALLENAKEQ